MKKIRARSCSPGLQCEVHEAHQAEVVMFVPLLLFFFVLLLPAIRDLVPGISVPQQYLQYIQHIAAAAAAETLLDTGCSFSVPSLFALTFCQLCVWVDLLPIYAPEVTRWGGPLARVMGTTHSGGYRSRRWLCFLALLLSALTCQMVVQQVLGIYRAKWSPLFVSWSGDGWWDRFLIFFF